MLRLNRKVPAALTQNGPGTALLEVLVSLAIIGMAAVAFLGGLTTTSKAAIVNDERATAESLARSQMEWTRDSAYIVGTTEYIPASLPGGKDYADYSVTIAAEPVHVSDDGIQRVAVIVKRYGNEVLRLEGYKMDR